MVIAEILVSYWIQIMLSWLTLSIRNSPLCSKGGSCEQDNNLHAIEFEKSLRAIYYLHKEHEAWLEESVVRLHVPQSNQALAAVYHLPTPEISM